MNIANSITATSIIGSEIDLNTKAMIMKIRKIETKLTVAKSLFVILIRSLVQAASPTNIPFLSYFFIIFSISLHWLLASSEPVLYADMNISISCSSLSNSFVKSLGINDSGTEPSKTLSFPNAICTPSTFLTSSSIADTSFDFTSESNKIMFAEPKSYSFAILFWATTLSKESGRLNVKS